MLKKIVALSLIATAIVIPSEAAFANDNVSNNVSANIQAQMPVQSVQSIGEITPFTVDYTVIGNGVRIRKDPSLNGRILGLLYKGDVVNGGHYTEFHDGYEWIYVTSYSTGISGWVVMDYLEG
jgi:hypothetical protein